MVNNSEALAEEILIRKYHDKYWPEKLEFMDRRSGNLSAGFEIAEQSSFSPCPRSEEEEKAATLPVSFSEGPEQDTAVTSSMHHFT